MKDLVLSYFLCAVGLFTPLAGLHRFYLDKPVSACLYLFTWGFFGIGTIIDLFRMPLLVDERNLYSLLLRKDILPRRATLSSPERAILQCAKNNDGVVTIPMVTLSSGLSMAQSKMELDRLYREGFCQKDVDEEGNEIFQFHGLTAKKSLD